MRIISIKKKKSLLLKINQIVIKKQQKRNAMCIACIWEPSCIALTSQIRSRAWFLNLALWWGDKSSQKKGSAEDKSIIALSLLVCFQLSEWFKAHGELWPTALYFSLSLTPSPSLRQNLEQRTTQKRTRIRHPPPPWTGLDLYPVGASRSGGRREKVVERHRARDKHENASYPSNRSFSAGVLKSSTLSSSSCDSPESKISLCFKSM